MNQENSNGIITWQSSGGRWNILAGELGNIHPGVSIPASTHPFIRNPWYSSSLWESAEEALAELRKRHPETSGYAHEKYPKSTDRSLALLTSSSFQMTDLPDVFFVDVEHGTIDFRDPKIAALTTLRDEVHAISWLTIDETDFDLQSWMALPEGLRARLVSDVNPGGNRLFKLITETYLPILDKEGNGIFWGNGNYPVRMEKELALDLRATADGPESTAHDSLFVQAAYTVGKTLGGPDAASAFISHHAASFIWVAVTPAMVPLGMRSEKFQQTVRDMLTETIANSNPKAAAEITDAFKKHDSHALTVLTQLRVASSSHF